MEDLCCDYAMSCVIRSVWNTLTRNAPDMTWLKKPTKKTQNKTKLLVLVLLADLQVSAMLVLDTQVHCSLFSFPSMRLR